MEIQNISGSDTVPVSRLHENPAPEKEISKKPEVETEEKPQEQDRGNNIDVLA